MKSCLKAKRWLAMLLVLAMLLGQTELIVPRARAAEPEEAPLPSGEVGAAPSADAEGGDSMPILLGEPDMAPEGELSGEEEGAPEIHHS